MGFPVFFERSSERGSKPFLFRLRLVKSDVDFLLSVTKGSDSLFIRSGEGSGFVRETGRGRGLGRH